MSLKFRHLKADEIDVRVQSIKEKGAVLLLYKDARCDMNILDETVGIYNWQRQHTRDNKNCIVSIWDKEKQQWIVKEDTGVESYTEKEKGLASDSFKRACFNWGIGRELYTAPFIYVKNEGDFKQYKGKWTTYTNFYVESIQIEDNKISAIAIKDEKGRTRFTWKKGGKSKSPKPKSKPKSKDTVTTDEITVINDLIKEKGIDKDTFLKFLEDKINVSKIEDIPQVHYAKVVGILEKK